MRRVRWLLLSLSSCLPLACASTTTMIGQKLHPVAAPRPEVLAVSQRLAASARDHVYVFFINGLDPNHYCNFRGQSEYVLALGYRNVDFCQMWDRRRCEDKIRQIRREDAQARIVMIGYSAGVYLVRDMAHTLNEDSTRIDLLVYLGGDVLTNSPDARPANAAKILNIRGKGLIFLASLVNGADLDGCENHTLGTTFHSDLPSNQQVLELLAARLAEQALATGTTR